MTTCNIAIYHGNKCFFVLLPPGNPGQVLTQTEDCVEWKDPVISPLTPDVTDGHLIATYLNENGDTVEIQETVTQFVNTIQGNRIGTYFNEEGTQIDVYETVTQLTDNGDGSLTYVNEAGTSVTIGWASQVTDTVDGHLIATHTSADGTVVEIDETITEVTDALTDGNLIAHYVGEDGTIYAINETCTDLVNNNDGTFSFTNECGEIVTVGWASLITNTIDGHRIATHTSADGTVVEIDETITAIADQIVGHLIANYIDESGLVHAINETVTALGYDPATTTLSYTDENGNTKNVDLSALAVDIFINGATFDASALALTFTDNDPATPDIVVNLAALVSTVEQLNSGHLIAKHTSGDGSVVNIEETITQVANTIDGNPIGQYINENGDIVDIDETITRMTDNGDGSFSYLNEAGETVTVQPVVSSVTDTVDGHLIATHISGDGTAVEIDETITGLTNLLPSGMTIGTYTAEDGSTQDILMTWPTFEQDPSTKIITITYPDGTTQEINPCDCPDGPVLPDCTDPLECYLSMVAANDPGATRMWSLGDQGFDPATIFAAGQTFDIDGPNAGTFDFSATNANNDTSRLAIFNAGTTGSYIRISGLGNNGPTCITFNFSQPTCGVFSCALSDNGIAGPAVADFSGDGIFVGSGRIDRSPAPVFSGSGTNNLTATVDASTGDSSGYGLIMFENMTTLTVCSNGGPNPLGIYFQESCDNPGVNIAYCPTTGEFFVLDKDTGQYVVDPTITGYGEWAPIDCA